MKLKRNFIFFYSVIFFTAVMFVLLIFLSRLPFNLFFINKLFGEQNLTIVSKIVYMEGEKIFFGLKNSKMEPVKYSTQIKRGMTIQTGKDSYLSFHIKNQGYYILSPNSTIYLSKIENYMPTALTKKSQITVEKGIFYANVNFLSNNSFLVINTSNMYSRINSGFIKIDKRDEFQTGLECYNGNVYFRANSSKFDLFREKKTYIITGSIERLLNNSNMLTANHYCIIKYDMQQKLDNLLNKIYESKNLSIINKEYIKSAISIPIFPLNKRLDSKFEDKLESDKLQFLMHYIEKSYRTKTAQVSITVSNRKSKIYFGNKLLSNKKYLFTLPVGKYSILQLYDFTRIIYYFDVGKAKYQNIQIKNFSGIKSVKLNNMKILYNLTNFNNKKYNNFPKNLIKNTLLIDIDTQNIDKINNISINSDLEVLKLYILSKSIIYNSNVKKLTGKYFIDNSYYYLYLYIGNITNDIIKINLPGIFNKIDSLKIICKFNKTYRFYY